jgi:cardiolipin synthase
MKQLFLFGLITIFILACGGEEPRAEVVETPVDQPARSFERWAGATVPAPELPPARPIRALWDTYYLPVAIELIDSAETEIELVHFMFTYGPTVGRIQEALGRAVDRGVKVRAIFDEEPPGSARSLPHLTRRGIEAKLDGARTRTHVKLILVDRRRALFGSTNLSDNSINNNHETNLLVESEEVGAALKRYADELHRDANRSIEVEPVRIDGLDVHMDRSFEAELMALLAGARERIELQMYGTSLYPDDPKSPSTAAFNALRDAARRGVKVRVLLERGQDDDWGRETNRRNEEVACYLRAAGVEVRVDPAEVISHAKLLLVDDAVTVGSMNWGFGGFRLYHELNAIVRDPGAVREFRGYFETIWSRGE